MQLKEILRSQQLDTREAALAMAVGILVERIRSLPAGDRHDLYELSKAVGQAESDEEVESAARAMYEILEQAPVRVQRMDLPPGSGGGSAECPEGLRRWTAFVSKRIRTLRKQKGLTQIQLAKRSGLPQSHISRLEAGKHSPSFTTLEKLAHALGVSTAELDPSG